MHILAIDTSCDDTSCAITRNAVVLSNVVSSQDEIHGQWGGVVPNLAKRAHQERIDNVVELACKRAKIALADVDVFAVTYGPGLAISLEVGIAKAKELAGKYKKPLIAVNHMEGHIYANFAETEKTSRKIEFPLLALLVSGGHTELVLMKNHGDYDIIGQTLDDAAGEAYDKIARMIGLGYPGGAFLAKLAEEGNAQTYTLPLPLPPANNPNFSFSGIKTAVMRLVKSLTNSGEVPLTREQIQNVAASFQQIAIEHLVRKTLTAVKKYEPKTVLLGGGVAANLALRKRLRKELRLLKILLCYPRSKKLCSDNAAMIAIAAYYKAQRKEFVGNIEALDRDPVLQFTAAPAGQ